MRLKENCSPARYACFDIAQVLYERDCFDGEKVSASSNITSKEYSIVPMEAFEIYSLNHDRDTKKYILSLDKHNYYMMNIIDYLLGTLTGTGETGVC